MKVLRQDCTNVCNTTKLVACYTKVARRKRDSPPSELLTVQGNSFTLQDVKQGQTIGLLR